VLTRTDELTGTRVTATLERLAERRVSGVMEIDGNPAGTIYLNHGQITFAQASWIPDLRARLLGALRLSAASRELSTGPDRPDRDIGTVLVQRNYLSRGDLQAILRSVVVDAALVLMLPADRDAFISDIRFAAPGTPGASQHWAGAFSSLCVDFVLAEVIKKAERMARFKVARTTPVRLRDLGAASAVLSREQWAVACAIDGARSVQDLAWTCGLALYEAIECVGRLIQAGVCVPEPAEPAGPLARWFGPEVLSPTAVLPPARTDLPQRVPQAREDRPLMSAPVWPADMPASDDFTSAQPELLRRVLDGLRRLG
jgi:uncharacterized protein DUF4388